MKNNQGNLIPIFFATDDNYAPYLVVALQSMLDHADKSYDYKVHVLCTTLSPMTINIIESYNSDNVEIIFVDVQSELNKLSTTLHLRDYYTKAIYYRLFISALCPQYSKALYIDCDVIFNDDVAKLYNHDISGVVAGVVNEDVMTTFDVFGTYAEKTLGVDRYEYFNSGLLLLNLDMYRQENIDEKFVHLLTTYKLEVAPDQDYLNILLHGRTLLMDKGWNRAPIPGTELSDAELKLAHYKIAWKPWNYHDVMYEQYFWKYAEQTPYHAMFLANRANFSDADKQVDVDAYNNLVITAERYTNDPNNYFNTISRK